MASKIEVDEIMNAGGDNDSGIDLATNDKIKFKIAGSERAVIESNGRLGMGTSSPSHPLHIVTSTDGTGLSGDDSWAALIQNAEATDARSYGLKIQAGSTTDQALNIQDHDGSNTLFSINGYGEFSSGNNDPSDDSPTLGFQVDHGGGSGTYINIGHTTGAGNGYSYARYFYNGGNIGSISQNGTTGVNYHTSSDYRLKENVVTDWDATSRLKQLKPSRFNFKTEKDRTVDGFLAHEVSSIVPEAITGEKDAVDKDGKPEYQGIDQSKLVPLLVKTIQELEARIAALESK